MKNYVVTYELTDKNSSENFLKELQLKFPINRIIVENDILYFNFSERKIARVKDTIQRVMDGIDIRDSDFIALYYTRDEEPDLINRQMIVGSSFDIDNNLNRVKLSSTRNEVILGELLDFDFRKITV